MGLFGKGKDIDDFQIEQSGFDIDNTGEHIDNTVSAADTSGLNNQSSNINPMNYGIQDAIELIRQLPNVDSDITITVVRKTLESTKIQVSEIIADAQQREEKIEDRSGTLATKIDELKKQIEELNIEITQLNSDLEETTRVKSLLIRSVDQDSPTPAKSSPKKQTSTKDGKAPATTASETEADSSSKDSGIDKLSVA